MGHETALIVHKLGDVGGLAAGGGAEIQHSIAGLWAELGDGQEGAGILDVKPAVGKARQGGEGGMTGELEDLVFRPGSRGDEIVVDSFGAPAFEEGGGVGFEAVESGVGFGRGVVPLEQLGDAGGVPALEPAGDQPIGLGITQGGLGDFEIGEQPAGGFGLAQATAQNGVDEAGLGAEAGAFGQLDGFMNGGVRRDAVEPEDLVEAGLEEDLEGGALFAAGGFAGDEPVERGLPADDAIDNLLAEAAVGRRQAGSGEGGFEQIFGEIAAGAPLAQDPGRNFSWILFGEHV